MNKNSKLLNYLVERVRHTDRIIVEVSSYEFEGQLFNENDIEELRTEVENKYLHKNIVINKFQPGTLGDPFIVCYKGLECII